jgi:hypothetical protein
LRARRHLTLVESRTRQNDALREFALAARLLEAYRYERK